jgi:hypothetical protein
MAKNPEQPGIRILLVAFILIAVIPGSVLLLLILQPFSPRVQAVWYTILGIITITLIACEVIMHTTDVVIQLHATGIRKIASAVFLLLVATALVVGIAWLTPSQPSEPAIPDPVTKHADPKTQSAELVTYIYDELDLIRNRTDAKPTAESIATILKVNDGDPHKLAEHYDNQIGAFIDAWGNPIQLKNGAFNRFAIWSYGPNEIDNLGTEDDITRGDLVVVNLNPKDKIADGVKGLFKRNKDDEEPNPQGD